MPPEAERLESPTSILTYLQCPRKYYYRYVKRLAQRSSIHLVLGSLVHSAIEAFHKTDFDSLSSVGIFETLRARLFEHFDQEWISMREGLESLNLTPGELGVYYGDARLMLDNFFRHHISKVVSCQYNYNLGISEALKMLRPRSELKIISERLGLMGFIDAVHDFGGEILIIDYKTSRKEEISEENKIQLSLYSLLYKDSFGVAPDKVGIHFLRNEEKIIPVKPELMALGESTCQNIHNLAKSRNLTDYPRKFSPLCKFSSGQCDYYDVCRG